MSSRSSNDSISTVSESPNGGAKLKRSTSIEDISNVITYILQQIISENELTARRLKSIHDDDNTLDNCFSSLFIGTHIPSISIENFIRRIIRYCKLEKSTLILSLIYIDRYCEYTKVILSKKNIHRIVLLSVLVAIKYNEDEKCGLPFYSKVGGVPVGELLHLEIMFLIGIEYALFVNEYVYDKYETYIDKFIAV